MDRKEFEEKTKKLIGDCGRELDELAVQTWRDSGLASGGPSAFPPVADMTVRRHNPLDLGGLLDRLDGVWQSLDAKYREKAYEVCSRCREKCEAVGREYAKSCGFAVGDVVDYESRSGDCQTYRGKVKSFGAECAGGNPCAPPSGVVPFAVVERWERLTNYGCGDRKWWDWEEQAERVPLEGSKLKTIGSRPATVHKSERALKQAAQRLFADFYRKSAKLAAEVGECLSPWQDGDRLWIRVTGRERGCVAVECVGTRPARTFRLKDDPTLAKEVPFDFSRDMSDSYEIVGRVIISEDKLLGEDVDAGDEITFGRRDVACPVTEETRTCDKFAAWDRHGVNLKNGGTGKAE